MPQLNLVPQEFVEKLAHGLRQRQIARALTSRGFSLSAGPEKDTLTATDAMYRTAIVGVRRDGSVSVSTEDGNTVTRWFDTEGRLRRVVDAGGSELNIDHEGAVTRFDRGAFGVFTLEVDRLGNLKRVEYPDGTASTIDWEDSDGEIITLRSGQTIQRLRDDNGEHIASVAADGRRHVYLASDTPQSFLERRSSSGRIDRYDLAADGSLECWSVDGAVIARAEGRSVGMLPRRVQYRDGRWAEYQVADGRIGGATGSGGTVLLKRDAEGLLLEDTQGSATVSYLRDACGALAYIQLPDRSHLHFSYDNSGRLEGVTDWSGQFTRISWAKSGQLSTLVHPNGVTTDVGSDALARITAMVIREQSGQAIFEGRYSYDMLDHLVAAEENGQRSRYSYDALDRLTAAESTDAALTELWELDVWGNRLRDGRREFTVGPDDRITGWGKDAIGYDTLGRIADVWLPNGRRGIITHDGRGQISRIDFGDGGLAEYGYDAFGRRTWKRVDGRLTHFLWTSGTLASEVREPGEGWTRRDHLFLPDLWLPIAMRVDGNIVRLHCDRRGAPQSATGSDGRLLWRARLKAFGEALIDVHKIDQPWRLPGQYCDEESGLHYNLNRYYHPGLGRYLSEDPLFDPSTRGNPYLYAAGDPLANADPTGEIIIPAILIAAAVAGTAGALIGAAVKAYETRGQPWDSKRWKEVGTAALIGGIGGAVGAAAGMAAVGAAGLAGAVGVGALIGGAIDGGVSAVAQGCAEAAMYDKAVSMQQVMKDAAIGAALGAVSAGVGGLVARKMKLNKKLDEIYAKAAAAKDEVDAIADAIKDEVGGRVAKAPLKGRARALEKAKEYIRDTGIDNLHNELKDIARNTIVVPKEEYQKTVEALRKRGAKIKMINAADNPMGYSGTNSTIKTKAGIPAEIQVNTPDMIFAKEKPKDAIAILGLKQYEEIAAKTGMEGGLGHKLYEEARTLPSDHPNLVRIAKESRAYYDAIRKKAN